MSQTVDSASSHAGGTRVAMRAGLYLVLAGVVGFCGFRGWQTYQAVSADPVFEKQVVANFGLNDAPHRHLDPSFTDANGDLLADTPSDPAQLVDPPSIELSHVQDDPGSGGDSLDWSLLGKQIGDAAGKPVTVVSFSDARGELDRIKGGKIQIMVVHAADAPYLVNQFGFIPIAVAGDDKGPHGHRLDLVVPAKSDIKAPEDIRGHNLVCTQPLSVSGYRAALAYLHENLHMRPGFDFTVSFVMGQRESVLALGSGKSEAAALSSDKLKSMTKSGEIAATDYRIIYESEVMPQYAIGTFYNLKPEVAANIKKAVLSFTNPPQPGDKGSPIRLLPVDYARDFATLRSIDDAFEPRLLMPPKSSQAPAPKD